MLNFVVLIFLGSMGGFVVGLVNPRWVLIGEKRTRLKSCKVYFGVWLLSFFIIGTFAPKKKSLSATQPQVVAALPTSTLTPLPEVTPTSTPEVTPTPTPQLTDVLLAEPEISDPVGEEDDSGRNIQRTEKRKFRTPEGKTKTVYTIIKEIASNGFLEITTTVETNTNGILTRRVETKTQNQDGTITEIKNTNEWGITTTEKTQSKEVSDEFKATLALTPRSFKADPQIQPDPEPEPQPATQAPTYPSGMTCSDFASQSEAQSALPNNPQLDRDGDGTACESLSSGGGGGSFQG